MGSDMLVLKVLSMGDCHSIDRRRCSSKLLLKHLSCKIKIEILARLSQSLCGKMMFTTCLQHPTTNSNEGNRGRHTLLTETLKNKAVQKL